MSPEQWMGLALNGVTWAVIGGAVMLLTVRAIARFRPGYGRCVLAVLIAYGLGMGLITSLQDAGAVSAGQAAPVSPLVGVLIAVVVQTIVFLVLIRGPRGERLGLGRSAVAAVLLSVAGVVFTIAAGMVRTVIGAA